MEMLVRLRYLLAEGFEVRSISGYDDNSGNGNAKLMFVEQSDDGSRRLHSEIFDVDAGEMERCSMLFLASLSQR